ncbi:MAG TPA: hypothetical protein PKC25_09040, partial [Candidatus Rifleibacterium sp.]|nr:hypothetical protein [Candidatus Rifleibacterium sp.]
MAEGLKVLHQQLLYEAQKQILSSGKNTDVILQILSRTSVDLFGKKGFGVLFYDASAQISRIRFNDGFSVKSLNFHCEEFTRSKLERRPFPAGPVADESGETHVLIPLGPDSDPFGVLLLQEMSSSEAGTLAAFRELATTSISTFLEVE